MTNSEIEAEIGSLKKEISKMQETVKPFKSGNRKLITAAEIAK